MKQVPIVIIAGDSKRDPCAFHKSNACSHPFFRLDLGDKWKAKKVVDQLFRLLLSAGDEPNHRHCLLPPARCTGDLDMLELWGRSHVLDYLLGDSKRVEEQELAIATFAP